jgi:hypothetical protein
MKRRMEMEGDRNESRKEMPGRRCISENRCEPWDQIYIKTPNPKCWLSLKIDQ